jgi:hypothetical protein
MTTDEKLAKALADRDRFRDGWLARGRELNALFDVINEVAGDQGHRDPVMDLRSLKAKRDALEHSLYVALASLEKWQEAGRLHSA